MRGSSYISIHLLCAGTRRFFPRAEAKPALIRWFYISDDVVLHSKINVCRHNVHADFFHEQREAKPALVRRCYISDEMGLHSKINAAFRSTR